MGPPRPDATATVERVVGLRSQWTCLGGWLVGVRHDTSVSVAEVIRILGMLLDFFRSKGDLAG